MNASLSDGNEPVIDIFILSANSPLSSQLEQQLREDGYYVTLFPDGTHLLETLRNGKPNLLICDATPEDTDAYEVCRQIKVDEYLWNIPVLLMTAATDLGDLLRVLDCNADNFIACPYDPAYLLSLIEGMLTLPVERQQTPEQIKTQFKIKHDDQVFVVTADRRKLLEFLLSSFEIAVNKSTDLNRALEDIRSSETTIRQLENHVAENTKVIGIVNDTLKARELKVAELNRQIADREQAVLEKTDILDRLSSELEQEKAGAAEAREEIRRITAERDESLAASRSSIGELEQRVSDMAAELAAVRSALTRANEELAAESARLKDTEEGLATESAQREEAETALRSITADHEQLKIHFGSMKTRAEDTDKELETVLSAKAQSEQDHAKIIDDLKDTVKEQASALVKNREEFTAERSRLEEDLEAERTRRRDLEVQFTNLRDESAADRARLEGELESERVSSQKAAEETRNALAARELAEAGLRQNLDEAQQEILALRDQLSAAESRTRDKEQEIGALNAELAEARSARDTLEQELASASGALAEAKTGLEGGQQEILALRAQLDSAASRIHDTEQEIGALNAELAGVRSARDTLEQELASASGALTEAKSGLEGGQQEILALRAQLDSAESRLRAREQDLASASQALAEAKAGSESRQQDLLRLQEELGTATSRIREKDEALRTLNDELSAVRSDQEVSEQDLASVNNALNETKALLEERQRDILGLQEKLGKAANLIEEKEKELQSLGGELSGSQSSRHTMEQELTTTSRALAEKESVLSATTVKLAAVQAEKEKAESLAESLSLSLKEFRDQLEQEKLRFRDAESRMNALILQRDRELGETRRVQEDARMTVSSNRNALEQMRRSYDSAVEAGKELEEKLAAADDKILRIGQDLENASRGREGDRQQISSLAGELEKSRETIEREALRRQEAEDQLREALSQQQQLEQDLERFVAEAKNLNAELVTERRLHEAAEKRKEDLESELASVSREKQQAEKTVADLSAEIGQARTALADEWEDHMTDHERLLAAVDRKQAHPSPAPVSGVKKEAEIIKKRSLIVRMPGFPSESPVSRVPESRSPAAPATVPPRPEIVVISEPAPASAEPSPVIPDIRSVEDLFEDDEDTEIPLHTEGAGTVQPPAGTPLDAPAPVVEPAPAGEESFFEEDTGSPEPVTGDGEAGEDEEFPPDAGEAPAENITFDRNQWLDLLKWSHHCEALTQDQRNHIVRMGRLIQRGRRLTRRQEEQVGEMLALVQSLGYRVP